MPLQPNGSAKNNLLRIFSFGKNNATIFFLLLFVLSAVFAAQSSAAQNATYERLAKTENSTYPLIKSTANLASTKTSTTSNAITALTLTATLPTGNVGSAYSGAISATGGVSPYSFSVSAGALPTGLSLNASTGKIIGTPSVVISKAFWVKVSDAQGNSNRLHSTITIDASVTPTSPATTVSVSPSSVSLTAGGSEQFSALVQGTSNTAVTWSANAGSISSSGLFTAPNVSTSTTVTVTATSAADTNAHASASVDVAPAAVVSISVSPTSSTVTSGKTQQFAATVQGTTNTAVNWSTSAGSVSSSGVFTAPSVSASTSVTVTATSASDSTKHASASVTVNPAVAPLAISTASVPGAQASSSYSFPLSATGGSTPYQWNLTGGSLPQGFSLSSTGQLSGTTIQTGSFSFTAQVRDSASNSASQTFSLAVAAAAAPTSPTTGSSNFDGPAELPRVYMSTSLADTPAPGAIISVPAGGSLGTALNNANCGDTIELAAGATFSGNVGFPAKGCDDQHWIIVRTSAPDSALPAEGTRMQPCYAGVSSLPGRPAFTCPATTNVLAKIISTATNSTGPILLAQGANHYRLIGIEITRTPGTGIAYELVSVVSGTANHIILDRVWLHGSAQDDNKNGITLSGMNNVALIDSYANDFHCTAISGACTDAKVVGGGNSNTLDGTFKITNNFLEASGENILFGGAAAATTPADIEIRHNHFFKPLSWMPGQPGFVGGTSGHPFIVKNLLELKNAQRVLIEGNIFENSWGGFSQFGYGILMTPKNQSGWCPLCEVTDVTIRYNTVSHTGAGISMANFADAPGEYGQAGERYSIHDVTLDDINMSFYAGTGTLFQVDSTWPTVALNSITINHVTGFSDPNSKIMSLANLTTNSPMSGFTFTNSIIGQSMYPVWSATGSASDCSISNRPLSALKTCFPSGYTYSRNAMIAVNLSNYPTSVWPAGNYFPASASTVQFTSFNGAHGGDYTLLSTSPYKNAGSDGKDLGADIAAIQSATAGAY